MARLVSLHAVAALDELGQMQVPRLGLSWWQWEQQQQVNPPPPGPPLPLLSSHSKDVLVAILELLFAAVCELQQTVRCFGAWWNLCKRECTNSLHMTQGRMSEDRHRLGFRSAPKP